PFSRDVAVFDVRLPYLVDGDNFSVAADASDRPALATTSGKKDSHLFAETIDPLLVNHQPVLPAQPVCQLVIAVRVSVTVNGRSQQILYGVVADGQAIEREHEPRKWATAPASRSLQGVAL